MRIISSQSFFLYAARPTFISTVDSGAEKSPVSMAPVPPPPTVISAATEQSGVKKSPPQWHQCLPLPLSFRPQRSKAEWSGEISGPNGTSASPAHCHFDRNGAKRSGTEKSPVSIAPVPPPPTCHFDRNGAKRSGVEKSPAPMVPVPPPPTVISTATEQSGVEWRNLRPQWHRPHCGGRSRGSEPQWSSNTLTFLPIRSTARDDRAAYHHFGKFQSIEAKKKEL